MSQELEDRAVSDVGRIKSVVREYHESYRHSDLPNLSVSELYCLDKRLSEGVPDDHVWPARWPQAARPGVYFLLGAERKLLYIGRADNLGTRLSNYFRYGEDRQCVPKDDWADRPPCFLLTVAVAEKFEASSLEEYLIDRLDPPTNVRGRRDR